MLLRLSAAAPREPGDPSHPQVRLPASGAWSPEDLDQVTGHLKRGDCVHLTLTVPHVGLLSATWRRRAATGEGGAHDRLTDLARVVGPDASRVMVRIERQPGALSRWWHSWAWRRGVGGAERPRTCERRLDALLAPDEIHDETYVDETGPCEGSPHVLAVAADPLSWDVIDELHGCVSAGREVHLVLALPRSPISRDPDLHLLWERRMACDVADRQREVAQLWPGTRLVQVEVVRRHPTWTRSRRTRRLARRLR